MPWTVRTAAREWKQAFTDTIPKEAGVAGLGEAPAAARPAGPNLWQHAWSFQTSRTHDQPIVVLIDSKKFMKVASN